MKRGFRFDFAICYAGDDMCIASDLYQLLNVAVVLPLEDAEHGPAPIA